MREVHCPLQNIATGRFAEASPIRTVIAADFDNDKELEVFFNNIAYRENAPNRLFRLDSMCLLIFPMKCICNLKNNQIFGGVVSFFAECQGGLMQTL